MIDKKALCEFLVRAKKATYASGDEKKEVKEDDGFSGEEKILRLEKNIYMAKYAGGLICL
jgi:hypothetical protein